MREARARGGGTRFSALSGRTRQAHLRERLEGGVGAMAQAPDDARERESPVARGCPRAQMARRADGEALLRHRRRDARRLRAALAMKAPGGAKESAGVAPGPASISRYPVPQLADLPDDIRARILEVQQKAGFVPNVFLTLAH